MKLIKWVLSLIRKGCVFVKQTGSKQRSIRAMHTHGLVSPSITGAWMFTREQSNPIIPVISYVLEIKDWGLKIIWLGPLIFPILHLLLPRSVTGESGTALIGLGIAGFLVTSIVVAGICCARLEDSSWIDTQMSESSARWIRYTDDFVKLLLATFPTVKINNRNLDWYEKVEWDIAMPAIKEKTRVVKLVHTRLCYLAVAIETTYLVITEESNTTARGGGMSFSLEGMIIY